MLAEMSFYLKHKFVAGVLPLNAGNKAFLSMLEQHPLTMLNRWDAQRFPSVNMPDNIFNRRYGDVIPEPVRGDLSDAWQHYQDVLSGHKGQHPVYDRAFLERTAQMTPDKFVREMKKLYKSVERENTRSLKDEIRFRALGVAAHGATLENGMHDDAIGVYAISYPSYLKKRALIVEERNVHDLLGQAFSGAVSADLERKRVRVGWSSTKSDLRFIDARLS